MPRQSADLLRAAVWPRGALCVVATLLALIVAAEPSRAEEPPRAAEEPPRDAQEPGTPEARATAPRFAVGAEVTVTVGPKDPFFFNYTDYDQNALRLFTGSLGASFITTSWLEAVGEVRVENTDHAEVSALYARVTPWASRRFTFLAGRVPPVFGAFARTRYGSDNPLISRPLAYQYLSTLRADAVPRSADALLAVRGRGWLVSYPGDPGTPAAAGLPMISASRWDTGVVANVTSNGVEVSGGVTMGSLSEPRVDDNNDGKQIVARAVWRPTVAWSLGVSAASGAYLDRHVAGVSDAARQSWPQRAVGVDAAFSRGYLQVRGEIIGATWAMPVVSSPAIDSPIGAKAGTLEIRYRVRPRVDAAVRGDWLGFSHIQGTLYGGAPTPWDADVSRVEFGGGLRLARGWVLKLVYQYDWRFGRRRVTKGYPAAQLAFWF